MKLADFGFARSLKNDDGSNKLRTRLGTEGYMAPEIHMRLPYQGDKVDIFAAGIMLFIMVVGTPPFLQARPTDPFYKLIV